MQKGFPKKAGIITGASDPEISSEDGAGMIVASFAVQREMDEAEAGSRTLSPRTAEELIALRDQHWERFSDAEMNILFQHLRETGMGDSEYDDAGWVMLQTYLRGVGIPIDIFPEQTDHCVVPKPKQLSDLFHHLWTTHQTGYRKMDWKVFHKQLTIRKVFV